MGNLVEMAVIRVECGALSRMKSKSDGIGSGQTLEGSFRVAGIKNNGVYRTQ
jgi:hypothetical protein